MPWPGPDRVPVRDALGVVPHPVAVDQVCAGRRRRCRASGRRRGPGHRRAGAPAACRAGPASSPRTRSWLPPMPPDVTITACAAQLEVADRRRGCWPRRARRRSGSRTAPRTPVTAPSVDGRARRPGAGSANVTRPSRRRPATRRANGATTPGPGAPGDVEAGDGVAGPVGDVAAALGPADDGEEPHAALAQPGALLAGGELDVRLGPAARPVRPRRGRSPAVPSQSCQASSSESLDPHPALLGRVDEEQAAEGPVRLAAEDCSRSWSTRITRRPARPAQPSRPARPGPRRRRSRQRPSRHLLACPSVSRPNRRF